MSTPPGSQQQPPPPPLPCQPIEPDLLALLHAANRHRAGAGSGAEAVAAQTLERRFAAATALAVYGTLAPGESNHHRVATLGGTWSRGHVRGRRGQRAFPVFTWDEAAAPVPVQLLQSPGLPAAWAALDDFEGAAYRRILVPVHLATGAIAVANLYAAVAPVDGGAGHSDGAGGVRP